MSESVTIPDVHGQVMVALRDDARRALATLWDHSEIQVRSGPVVNGTVFKGITIFDAGEVYDDGVIGFEDVGYRCGVAVIVQPTTDASIDSNRRLNRSIETLRRRWKNRRLPIEQFDYEAVRQHVLRLDHTPLSLPKNQRDKFVGQQLIVTSWTRELPDTGS